VLKDELGRQQHRNTDGGVEQRRAHRNPRQDFQRKYHFLDVVDVSEDEARRPVEVFGEKPVNDQSNEQHDREIGFALLIRAHRRASNTTENTKV